MATVKVTKLTLVGDAERKKIAEMHTDANKRNQEHKINDWEHSFIKNLYQGSLSSTYQEVYWTERQVTTLDNIERKLYRV